MLRINNCQSIIQERTSNHEYITSLESGRLAWLLYEGILKPATPLRPIDQVIFHIYSDITVTLVRH